VAAAKTVDSPGPGATMASMLRRMMLIWPCLAIPLTAWGASELPVRDLTVELRETDEAVDDAVSYRAGTRSQGSRTATQLVRVRNGAKAVVQTRLSVPMVWMVAVQAPSATTGAGIAQALYWLETGQTLAVTPRWAGGRSDALVEMEWSRSDIREGTNPDLPQQGRAALSSTVGVVLGEWVTIAASGESAVARQGTQYSSDAASQTRRLLQIRVLAP